MAPNKKNIKNLNQGGKIQAASDKGLWCKQDAF